MRKQKQVINHFIADVVGHRMFVTVCTKSREQTAKSRRNPIYEAGDSNMSSTMVWTANASSRLARADPLSCIPARVHSSTSSLLSSFNSFARLYMRTATSCAPTLFCALQLAKKLLPAPCKFLSHHELDCGGVDASLASSDATPASKGSSSEVASCSCSRTSSPTSDEFSSPASLSFPSPGT